jgi:hypothetical protein
MLMNFLGYTNYFRPKGCGGLLICAPAEFLGSA